MKYFSIYTLGCRVNSAETNLFAQTLLNQGHIHRHSREANPPNIIFINTCSVTAKANVESLGLIRHLQKQYPKAKIIVSGCADTNNIQNLKNIAFISNTNKEAKLNILKSLYNPIIGDKFSNTHRYLLKIQSGCTANCSYCTVPLRRPYLWSLPIIDAVNTVNSVLNYGYREIIITGVNLLQYAPGFSNLIEALLTQTKVPLISFGSIPLLCIDNKFINLYKRYSARLSHFLHIPLQSGSNKILKLMNRPYDNLKIKKLIDNCKLKIDNLSLGTDIIVGFPGETNVDFQQTFDLCRLIGFQKFTFSASPLVPTPRLKTLRTIRKITKNEILKRSKLPNTFVSSFSILLMFPIVW